MWQYRHFQADTQEQWMTHKRNRFLTAAGMTIIILFSLPLTVCREKDSRLISLIFDETTAPPSGMIMDVKKKIKELEYVQEVSVAGLPEPAIEIVFDEQKLAAYTRRPGMEFIIEARVKKIIE
jgi:hypothetical protein